MHAFLAFIFIYIIDVYIYLFYIFYYKVKFRVYFQINQRDDCVLISVLNGITHETGVIFKRTRSLNSYVA